MDDPSTWHGQAVLRISVSNWRTIEEDVDRTLAAVRGFSLRFVPASSRVADTGLGHDQRQCRLAFSPMTKIPSIAPMAPLTRLPPRPSPPRRPARKL